MDSSLMLILSYWWGTLSFGNVQVVSPEFIFYDSSKLSMDDSLHIEKLLRAKMDFSFMFVFLSLVPLNHFVDFIIVDLTNLPPYRYNPLIRKQVCFKRKRHMGSISCSRPDSRSGFWSNCSRASGFFMEIYCSQWKNEHNIDIFGDMHPSFSECCFSLAQTAKSNPCSFAVRQY